MLGDAEGRCPKWTSRAQPLHIGGFQERHCQIGLNKERLATVFDGSVWRGAAGEQTMIEPTRVAASKGEEQGHNGGS